MDKLMNFIFTLAWGTSFVLIVCKLFGMFIGSWWIVFSPVLITIAIIIFIAYAGNLTENAIDSVKSVLKDRRVLKEMKQSE